MAFSGARPDFDPAVADQLSTLTLAAAQRNQQLNGVTARNLLVASATVLTLGVQINSAAALNQQVAIGPLEAASAANLRSSQEPSQMAGLAAAANLPAG